MSTEQLEFDYKGVSLFDRKNPDSLVNVLPVKLKERLLQMSKRWFTYSEGYLRGRVHPTDVENQLRISFWYEYSRATERGVTMQMSNVFGPVCTKDYFYRVIVKSDSKLAWLFYPPREYQIQVEEMLQVGLGKLREVLELPLVDKATKRPDTKLISEMVKIVALLDNRVKGSVVQRMAIQQQNLNVNVNAERESPKNVQDIDKELKKLDKEIRQIESPYKSDLARELVESTRVGSIDSEGSGVITVEASSVRTDEGEA